MKGHKKQKWKVIHPGPLVRVVAVVPGTLLAWAVLALTTVVFSLAVPFIILFGEWKVKQ